jgi:DNA/RNA endonuclease G (NUC1)
MTNILPQATNMNRGAWLLTEEITECYRDIDELLIIGGVLWGNNPNDDFFTESHGVKTPMLFGKSLFVMTELLRGLFQIAQMLKGINLTITS